MSVRYESRKTCAPFLFLFWTEEVIRMATQNNSTTTFTSSKTDLHMEVAS
jgi:hypothetical protein